MLGKQTFITTLWYSLIWTGKKRHNRPLHDGVKPGQSFICFVYTCKKIALVKETIRTRTSSNDIVKQSTNTIATSITFHKATQCWHFGSFHNALINYLKCKIEKLEAHRNKQKKKQLSQISSKNCTTNKVRRVEIFMEHQIKTRDVLQLSLQQFTTAIAHFK